MKKVLISTLLFSLALGSDYSSSDLAFKNGFEAGLRALEFQAKNEGYQPQQIIIQKPYLIYIDIEKMPLSEVVLLQNLASRNGYSTYLTKKILTFGDFDRKADAEETIKQIKFSFDIEPRIKETKGKLELITYPFLWQDFYFYLLENAKNNGVLLQTKVIEKTIEVQKPIVQKKEIQKINHKKILITLKNNKAMSYTLIRSDKNNSLNYIENILLGGKFEAESINPVITSSGEKFYKVKGLNLYFNELDVGAVK